MAAITGTLESNVASPAGEYSIVTVTSTLESASDTITLTDATHGITEITSIIGAVITSGQDAEMMNISASASGLVITVTSVGQDGLASSVWANGISVSVLGKL